MSKQTKLFPRSFPRGLCSRGGLGRPAAYGMQGQGRPAANGTQGQLVNRTCKACRISKVKCDLASSDDVPCCSRCSRLNLRCVVESRKNLSTGAARLKAPEVCALKLTAEECGVKPAAPIIPSSGPIGKELQWLGRLALLTKSPGLFAALLRYCGRVAWSRNDTQLMAWVMQQAAQNRLPLCDFAPAAVSTFAQPLEPPGTPPPFIGDVLCGGSIAVVHCFELEGGHSLWKVNDRFHREVCSRETLLDVPMCEACALFSPASEVRRDRTLHRISASFT